MTKLINDYNYIFDCIEKENIIKRKFIENFLENKQLDLFSTGQYNQYSKKGDIKNLCNFSLDNNMLINLLDDNYENDKKSLKNLNLFLSYYKNKKDISNIIKKLFYSNKVTFYKTFYKNNKYNISHLYEIESLYDNKKEYIYYLFNEKNLNVKIKTFEFDFKPIFINDENINKNILQFIKIQKKEKKHISYELVKFSYNIELNQEVPNSTEIISEQLFQIKDFRLINNRHLIYYGNDNIFNICLYLNEDFLNKKNDNKRLFIFKIEDLIILRKFHEFNDNINLFINDNKYIIFNTICKLFFYNIIDKTEKTFNNFTDNGLISLSSIIIDNKLFANLFFNYNNNNILLYIYHIEYKEVISKILIFNKILRFKNNNNDIDIKGSLKISQLYKIKIKFRFSSVEYCDRQEEVSFFTIYGITKKNIDSDDVIGKIILTLSKDKYYLYMEEILSASPGTSRNFSDQSFEDF